jgi:hypothetical protein
VFAAGFGFGVCNTPGREALEPRQQHRVQSLTALRGNRMKRKKWKHGRLLLVLCVPDQLCVVPLAQTPVLAFEPNKNARPAFDTAARNGVLASRSNAISSHVIDGRQ